MREIDSQIETITNSISELEGLISERNQNKNNYSAIEDMIEKLKAEIRRLNEQKQVEKIAVFLFYLKKKNIYIK